MESQLALVERKIDDLLASVNLPEEGLRNERGDASKGEASENKTGEGSK